MGRKAKPGQDIARLVAAGELDATGALAAVQDQMGAMLGEDSMPHEMGDMDEMDEAQHEDMKRLEKQEAEARRSRISALGHRLLTLAKDQVALRQATEERWYSDVRQFNGQYDPGTFSADEAGEQPYGSRVFVPLTRRLVNLCEARLFDMLFQSDERGYVLKPGAVPELEEGAQLAEKLPGEHPVNTPEGSVSAGSIGGAIKALIEEAQKRTDAMQREIDDQLQECKYPIQARNCIHDAVLLGTGVLKGPVALFKTAKRWKPGPDGKKHMLTMDRRPVPVIVRVDPWNFFPDMSATMVDECEFAFERHFLTKKQVAELKDMEDVDLDALREILGADPATQANNHRERLRSINGANGAPDKRYEVWEYHGPLSAEDLRDCGCEIEDEEEDPLEQYTGIVWFCEGVVLKAALNPLDTGSLPFRVFTWQKDESNIFGYGLPYEVRDSQVSANSSFRAMLDNMGLCVKPQVVVNDTKVEPINGGWDLEPGKFWRNKTGVSAKDAIEFINIESRLPELQAIFTAAKALIEEVGTLPAFVQGQEAPAAMQSATQASISWTAANLWVRRCVRNWDDDVVTPTIQDYYDWNMQHSPKDEIKGDSRPQALGIAALVELEGQAQKMQAFIQAAKAMGVPISNQMMMLRQFARSYKLDPDLVCPSEQEIAKMKEAEEKAGPPVNIEQEKLAVAKSNNEMDANTAKEAVASKKAELAQRDRSDQMRLQIALATIASNERITVEEVRTKYGFEAQKTSATLQDRQLERDHKSQMFNAESQLKVQQGSGI
jgi:hypothetical protein